MNYGLLLHISVAALVILAGVLHAEESGDWYWQISENVDPFEDESYNCFVVSFDQTLLALDNRGNPARIERGSIPILTIVKWPFGAFQENDFIDSLMSNREREYQSCEASAGEFEYCKRSNNVSEDVTIEAIINSEEVRFDTSVTTDYSQRVAFAFDIAAGSNDDAQVLFRVLFPPDHEEPQRQRELARSEFTVRYPLTALEKLAECSERETQRNHEAN